MATGARRREPLKNALALVTFNLDAPCIIAEATMATLSNVLKK
jgi:hypothetical protein